MGMVSGGGGAGDTIMWYPMNVSSPERGAC